LADLPVFEERCEMFGTTAVVVQEVHHIPYALAWVVQEEEATAVAGASGGVLPAMYLEVEARYDIADVVEPPTAVAGGHRVPTLVDRTAHFEEEEEAHLRDHLLRPDQLVLDFYFPSPLVAHLTVLHLVVAVAAAVVVAVVEGEAVLHGHHMLHSSFHFDRVSSVVH